ncbi:probable RNA polymerase II nuclear localization protein SLC7A6OS [Eurytemora carolleeae]|uniref:probable RNA polymerase II nuclear localization protein SLC7A6OS n=1 Tax=Eurytemora carolleeae TaxID=1294199 RepID=UPI000C77C940|nr:probable RNA polymerase II nuclear localization protein SLC7A6OS [Eurytemora carolleeae]|eukprot:XP_023319556.1 probable RNA polymerase II nuclear localization protein SLC7A6OS [Eurytemora affinis]
MSSTPTLLRVKRRITEDPTDIFVLSAKRLKSSSEDGTVKMLKLAGTVEQGDEDKLNQTLSRIINKKNVPNFAELKNKYKQSTKEKSSTENRTKEKEKERNNDRYRVVNTNRAIRIEELEAWSEENSDKSPDQEEPLYHLYDIVQHQDEEKEAAGGEKLSCNGVEMIREYVSKSSDENYVYDVYYAEGDALADFDDSLLDGLVSLQPFNSGTEFMYDEYRDNPMEDRYDDDEDSNDEDNEANDYPEEEDEDEDDYERSFGDYSENLDVRVRSLHMRAEEEEDLSSEDEDKLLYTQAFEEDASRHGSSYARFKQRMMKEFQEEDLLEDSEKDEDSDSFDYL